MATRTKKPTKKAPKKAVVKPAEKAAEPPAAKPAKATAEKTPRGGSTTKNAKTIDDYLAGVADDKRIALEGLRATIRKIVPKAEECISYSMPAFRVDGKVIAGFLATSTGCSYYPFSGSTLANLGDELEGWSQTKSALHFTPARPIPATLVKKLIRARIAENA